MNSKTILSMLIIAVVIFGLITYYKMKDYPTGDCCKDIKNEASTICKTCSDYSLYEKIIYVWKFS